MYQARQLKTTEQPSDHVNQKRTQRDGERFLVNIIFDDTQNSFTLKRMAYVLEYSCSIHTWNEQAKAGDGSVPLHAE